MVKSPEEKRIFYKCYSNLHWHQLGLPCPKQRNKTFIKDIFRNTGKKRERNITWMTPPTHTHTYVCAPQKWEGLRHLTYKSKEEEAKSFTPENKEKKGTTFGHQGVTTTLHYTWRILWDKHELTPM